MKLNLTQKLFLATFGVGIFFVQMIKFADDGIQGISWILALLVSVLLVLPAVGEAHRLRRLSMLTKISFGTNAQKTAAATPAMEGFVNFHKAQLSINQLLEGIEKHSSTLHSRVDQWLGFDATFRVSAAYMTMYEHVHQYCLAYCYGLTLLIEAQVDKTFMGSERQKILMARVAKLVVECNRSMLKKIGAEDKFDEAKQRSFAVKDITDVEKAVAWFMNDLASGGMKPDAELIRFFVDRLSVPEEKLPTFATSLQDFTKQLIKELALAKKSQ